MNLHTLLVFVIAIGIIFLIFHFGKLQSKRIGSLNSSGITVPLACQPIPIQNAGGDIIQMITGFPSALVVPVAFNQLDKSSLANIDVSSVSSSILSLKSIAGLDKMQMPNMSFKFTNLSSQTSRIYPCPSVGCCGDGQINGPVVYVDAELSLTIPVLTINYTTLGIINHTLTLNGCTLNGVILVKLKGDCDGDDYIVGVDTGPQALTIGYSSTNDEYAAQLITSLINDYSLMFIDILNKNIFPLNLNTQELKTLCT